MEDSNHIRKELSHTTVKWHIKHFNMMFAKSYYCIRSPEFYINAPQLTKWRLIFIYKDKDVGLVDLEMLKCQPNSEKIWINWKLCLMLEKQEVSIGESFYQFTTKTSINIGSYKIKDILKTLEPFGEKNLHLKCYLCASLERVNKANDFEDILRLSQDLRRLYADGKDCDITLKVHDSHCIHAHRAILASRNDILANLLYKHRGKEFIELPRYDYKIMKTIVEYLYSGSVQTLLKIPSNLLYRYAHLLNISELKQILSDQIEFSSSIKVQDFLSFCNHTDFDSEKEFCVKYTLKEGTSNTSLQLRLNQVDAQQVDFAFQITCGVKEQGICIDIRILDAKGYECLKTRKCQILKAREIYEFAETLDKNSSNIPSLINDGFNLTVRLRLTYYEEKHETVSGNSFETVICENCKVKFYNLLSTNMKFCLRDPMYSDITFIPQKGHFTAHRYILSARLLNFQKNKNEADANDKLKSLNISDSVFSIVLQYIYSGTLENINKSNVTCVWRAAEKLELSILQDACLRIVKENK